MLSDAVYTDSLGKAFIRSPKRIFYAYYSGAPSHSIEDGMSYRDQVQDRINSETFMFTSDQKGNSLAHLSIKTAKSSQSQEARMESSLLNDGNHWFLYCTFICILACLFKHFLHVETCLFLNENINAISMLVLKCSFRFYSSICYHSLNVLLSY